MYDAVRQAFVCSFILGDVAMQTCILALFVAQEKNKVTDGTERGIVINSN